MLIRASTVAWWALAFLFPLALVAGALGWSSEPRLGVVVDTLPDGRMEIIKFRPGITTFQESGIAVGDILVEVDGLAVSEGIIESGDVIGTSFAVLPADSNKTNDGVIRGNSESPISSTGVVASLLFVGLVFALTSFFVFFRSSRPPVVLVLSLLLIVFAIGFAIAPIAARWFPWAMFVQRLVNNWAAALFVMFFLLFQSRGESKRLLSTAVLYGMPIGALVISILYFLAFGMGIEIYDDVRQAGSLHIVLGLLGGIVFLIAEYAQSSSTANKEQLRIMVLGTAAPILAFVLLTVIPESMGLSTYVRPEISALGIVLIPFSFAFPILRHQFMNIRRLVHRSAAYALISVIVLVAYGFLIVTIRVSAGSEVSESVALQATLMVGLFAVLPFLFGTRRLAFATVDRLLYREYIEHPELTRRLSVDAATAQNTEEISSRVLGTLVNELGLSFASFSNVIDDRVSVSSSIGAVPSVIGNRVIALSRDPSLRTVTYSECPIDGNSGDAMLVEVKRGSTVTWVLCLGPKFTEEPFSHEDEDLAQSVAGHLTTVSEKLDLLDQLQTKNAELTEFAHRLVETEEAERSRIASYLHDEPLQEISNLIWSGAALGMPEEISRELQSIAENLRNFTARLQPAQLTDLGLVRSLEWLSAEAGAVGGFDTIVDADSVGRNSRFNSSIELALYRIAQEALTNCQQHSNAANVRTQLTKVDNRIVLTIEDDGEGFSPGIRSDANKQLGIIGMRERANQLGGRFEVLRRQPQGTKILVSLPLVDTGKSIPSEKAGS